MSPAARKDSPCISRQVSPTPAVHSPRAGPRAIFTAHMTIDGAKSFYADVKNGAVAYGQDRKTSWSCLASARRSVQASWKPNRFWEEERARRPDEHGSWLDETVGSLRRTLTSATLRLIVRSPGMIFPDPNEVEASRSRVVGYVEMTLREKLTLRQFASQAGGRSRPSWRLPVPQSKSG